MAGKRKFMVMRRSNNRVPIDVGRGRRKTWKENGGKADFFYVSSETEARDIDALYGPKASGDVWVREHGQMGHDSTYHEDGHKYHFGSSRTYAENYERIFKKARTGGDEPEVGNEKTKNHPKEKPGRKSKFEVFGKVEEAQEA